MIVPRERATLSKVVILHLPVAIAHDGEAVVAPVSIVLLQGNSKEESVLDSDTRALG